MSRFIILLALVCSVLSETVSDQPTLEKPRRQYFSDCLSASDLNVNDIVTLKEKTQYIPLTANEQKFICCISQPLITDGKLIMDRLRKIVDQKVKGIDVDLEGITSDCEKTGAHADQLMTCPQTATFAQCVFLKIRHIVENQQQTIKNTTNATESNQVPVNETTK